MQEFHLTQKFLVIVMGRSHSINNTLEEAFQKFWTNGLINSHVLIQDATESWTLNTFSPHEHDCNALSHLKIQSFTKFNYSSSIELPVSQVYSQKWRDLNGCPLFISPFIISPHVDIVRTPNGKYHYEGLDIEIIDAISKSLNFTAVYNVAPMNAEHAIIAKNRTLQEVIDVVYI